MNVTEEQLRQMLQSVRNALHALNGPIDCEIIVGIEYEVYAKSEQGEMRQKIAFQAPLRLIAESQKMKSIAPSVN